MQMFGNFTPLPTSSTPNGFAALAVYDDPKNGGNGDGIIDARDAVWQHPDLLPVAADLDDPAGFIDGIIGGDTSGIDEAIARALENPEDDGDD